MSRHRHVNKRNRSKLAKLVATGMFTVTTTAATATALAWPSPGASASVADLAASTQSQPPISALQSRDAIALHTVDFVVSEAGRTAAKAAAEQAAAAAAADHQAAVAVAQRAEAAATQRAASAAAQRAALPAAQRAASPAAQRAASPAASAAAKKQQAAGTPRQIAAAMLDDFGWSSGQMSCLEPLWQHESGWDVRAYNAGSGAYGIPQALPGSKMASAGPDWQTNAATQIKWGLGYIKNTYGSPCAAWNHERANGWY